MASHNAADIRGFINLLEGIQTPTILSEGPLTGLKAAFGDGKSQGELQRADLAARMKREWSVWLGQTGNKGSIEDMVKFLNVRVGLEPDDIRAIMGHDDVGSEPNPDIPDEPVASPQASEKPETPAPAAAPEVEDDDEEEEGGHRRPASSKNAYSNLSPEQRAELEAKGELTLPNGKRLWVGNKGQPTPDTISKVKDDDVKGAVSDLIGMSDQDLDDFVKSAIDGDFSEEEWAPVEAEMLRRQQAMLAGGKKKEAADIGDLVAELEKELGLTESYLVEKALSKQQAEMVFDDAAKYVFAHGILDREVEKAASPRGRGGRDSEEGTSSAGSLHKIRSFLRQEDITDEMVLSLRETARRARGLGAFRGTQDHKVLAMIGLAFLKYRD